MFSVSIELLPYFFLDVFYLNNDSKISILKCEINGTRIQLNDEQKMSLIDDINVILKYDI